VGFQCNFLVLLGWGVEKHYESDPYHGQPHKEACYCD
jgi:hypothetical protein